MSPGSPSSTARNRQVRAAKAAASVVFTAICGGRGERRRALAKEAGVQRREGKPGREGLQAWEAAPGGGGLKPHAVHTPQAHAHKLLPADTVSCTAGGDPTAPTLADTSMQFWKQLVLPALNAYLQPHPRRRASGGGCWRAAESEMRLHRLLRPPSVRTLPAALARPQTEKALRHVAVADPNSPARRCRHPLPGPHPSRPPPVPTDMHKHTTLPAPLTSPARG
jgi:hypothetical protein